MDKEKLKAELLAKYPFPCITECQQTEVCEYHNKCGVWHGWNFCIKRDLLRIIKRSEERKRLLKEIREAATWDDMERL